MNSKRLARLIESAVHKARRIGEHQAAAHLKAAVWYLSNDTNIPSERIERLTMEELEIAGRADLHVHSAVDGG